MLSVAVMGEIFSALCGGTCSVWWDLLCVVGPALCGGTCSVWWDLLCVVGPALCGMNMGALS